MDPLNDTDPWLLMILRDRVTFSWLDGDIGHGFTNGMDLFEGVWDAELTGFYDRIYNSSGEFVGLQIAPIRTPILTQYATKFAYARTLNGLHLQLFFTRGIPLDVKVTGDQAFGGRIYKSLGGDMALTIDTFFLAPNERRVIASAQADWVSVEGFA